MVIIIIMPKIRVLEKYSWKYGWIYYSTLFLRPCQTFMMELFLEKVSSYIHVWQGPLVVIVNYTLWCSGYHYCTTSFYWSLNKGSTQVKILFAVSQRFVMVRISGNGSSENKVYCIFVDQTLHGFLHFTS